MHSFARPSRRLAAAAALFSCGFAATACGGDVTIGDQMTTGDAAATPDAASHYDASGPGKDGAPATDSSSGSDGASGTDATTPGDDGSTGGDDSSTGGDDSSATDAPSPDDANTDACPPTGIDCIRGFHWDTVTCMCVPDGRDAGLDACVGVIICPVTSHWDPGLCTCVPNGSDAGPDACPGIRPCPPFETWDPGACMCMVNDGGGCVSSKGGECGGFTSNRCQCAPGLTCVYEAGIADLPGTCE